MSMVIEKEWTTTTGYPARCLIVHGSHRCGYVLVPKGSFLFGKRYDFHLEKGDWEKLEKAQGPFKGSPMDLVIAMGDRKGDIGPQLSYYINVHGGVTFSGPLFANDIGWWFGFDCAHAGDARMNDKEFRAPGDVVRSAEFVEKECESMAEQLARLNAISAN